MAWPALRAARGEIAAAGFKARSVDLALGLAEATGLCLLVEFASDAELARFNATSLAESITVLFRERLESSGYPSDAAAVADVSFHSHETIMRAGGYYYYYK